MNFIFAQVLILVVVFSVGAINADDNLEPINQDDGNADVGLVFRSARQAGCTSMCRRNRFDSGVWFGNTRSCRCLSIKTHGRKFNRFGNNNFGNQLEANAGGSGTTLVSRNTNRSRPNVRRNWRRLWTWNKPRRYPFHFRK